MGQILNIEITEGEKVLANAYYHWSGYTSSALGLTQYILDHLKNMPVVTKIANEIIPNRNILTAVRLLESTCAGLTDNELAYIKNTLKIDEKYKVCTGRNDGLIAVTPDGIAQTRHWEESRVTIDIVNKTVNFGAIWDSTDNGEEYITHDIDFKSIPFDIDFKSIPFDDFPRIGKIVCDLISQKIYGIQTSEGKVIDFIE